MKEARLELRIEKGLMDRVDAARGDVSRTRWVERALERALSVDALAKAGQAYGSGREVEFHIPDHLDDPPSRRVPADDLPANLRPRMPRAPGVVRASSLVKQGVRPIPKKGER
jgi:hypothetical protein